jgi:hypothetical protein
MDALNLSEKIGLQIASSVRRLLSQQDADPYSPTRGCFDRRYWAWKLADYPEATYQRNVQPLAELWADPHNPFHQDPKLLAAVLTGLEYAASIQHQDGSFDQAFPQERSFAATGFLLHSLLEAVSLVSQYMQPELRRCVEECLGRSADFLCRQNEKHGRITNHLAGVALALFLSGDYFGEPRFTRRAEDILEGILASQSEEGWFPEYEGADPGYLTLCVYYLAKIRERRPSRFLDLALNRSLDFLTYFVHPDGSFAGEYGSRRTQIFYPGGLALLVKSFPAASALIQKMMEAIARGLSVGIDDMDMGNLAPLLSNYTCAMQMRVIPEVAEVQPLPWEKSLVQQDFPQAGLFVRGTEHYYAIFGISNGGVLKVFDKREQSILWDDGGYIGKLSSEKHITTQVTLLSRSFKLGEEEIVMYSDFYSVLHSLPTPFHFLLLRLMNLTLMRNLKIGNLIKKKLVKLLVTGKYRHPMQLRRRVRFEGSRVIVEDLISKVPGLRLKWLEFGRQFVAIHMASAKYFEGWKLEKSLFVPRIDVGRLNKEQRLEVRVVIEGSHA